MSSDKRQMIEKMIAESQNKREEHSKKRVVIDDESLLMHYQNFHQGSPEREIEAEKDLMEVWRYWRERAMNFLVRREHSDVELRQKLRQRSVPEWLLDLLITWLEDQGYLSLERFAYSYAKNRADLGYGPIRVRYELSAEHQIPNRFINEAFREIDWEKAEKVAARKIRHTDPFKYRAALYRRGFSSAD